jgi:hypothetical protein
MLKAVRAVIESRAFCKTGEGGGIDNSCGSNKGGGGGGAGNAATIGSESGAISHEQAKRFSEERPKRLSVQTTEAHQSKRQSAQSSKSA